MEALLGPESPLGSSRWTDLGRGFLGLALGFPRPCSSRICCCFRRRYSCLMSSRRAFSSSLRIRSSSALRLAGGAAGRPSAPGTRGRRGHQGPARAATTYRASSLLSSTSASSCCLRTRASSALRCCFRRKAARFLASSSSAFCSSCKAEPPRAGGPHPGGTRSGSHHTARQCQRGPGTSHSSSRTRKHEQKDAPAKAPGACGHGAPLAPQTTRATGTDAGWPLAC